MKAHLLSAITGAAILLLGGCATMENGGGALGDSKPDSELTAASQQWDRQYNSNNAVAVAALYADDAVSMPPGAPTLKGRTALEADFQGFFAANTARHETMVDQIIRDGELAIERARYRLTYRPRAGGAEVVETGRHVECRRKIDGTWKIVVEIWNVDPPAGK